MAGPRGSRYYWEPGTTGCYSNTKDYYVESTLAAGLDDAQNVTVIYHGVPSYYYSIGIWKYQTTEFVDEAAPRVKLTFTLARWASQGWSGVKTDTVEKAATRDWPFDATVINIIASLALIPTSGVDDLPFLFGTAGPAVAKGGGVKRYEFDVPFTYRGLNPGTYRVTVTGVKTGGPEYPYQPDNAVNITLRQMSVQFVIDNG